MCHKIIHYFYTNIMTTKKKNLCIRKKNVSLLELSLSKLQCRKTNYELFNRRRYKLNFSS